MEARLVGLERSLRDSGGVVLPRLRSDLQARLAAMLSEHDEFVNRALVLRGRMLEIEHFLQTLAGLEENSVTSKEP